MASVPQSGLAAPRRDPIVVLTEREIRRLEAFLKMAGGGS